jgi:hypothetical protein
MVQQFAGRHFARRNNGFELAAEAASTCSGLPAGCITICGRFPALFYWGFVLYDETWFQRVVKVGGMKNNALLIFSLCLVATSAYAEIYKRVDENGRVTYSNIPMKGAKKLNLDPLPVVPAIKARNANPSPSDFPKVDLGTQKKRDDMRHQILEEELAAEERLLAEAGQTLKEAEGARGDKESSRLPSKYLERLQQLKENVVLHEKNIQALKLEIANLKH